MRTLASMMVVLILATGCNVSVYKRISNAERDHYSALKVYISDKDKKQFARLKTVDERNQWLKDRGIWQRFYQYESKRRDQILAGEVKVGWLQDQVFMAWGRPYAKRRLTGRRATRSELFVFRFEVDAQGKVFVWAPKSKQTYHAVKFYQLELYVDDGVVTEIVRKNKWE